MIDANSYDKKKNNDYRLKTNMRFDGKIKGYAKAGLALLASAAMIAPLTACSSPLGEDPDKTLNIVAGSEVKDVEPIIQDFESKNGVKINFTYKGTLDGTETVIANKGDGFDATWFPSNAYMSLFPEKKSIIQKEQSVMSSPVVLGMKPEAAKRLGWDAKQPTWDDIVKTATDGGFTYGMSSPVSSNSAFSTLIELSTALSKTGVALTEDNVKTVQPSLKGFANGQKLTSGSSGWLMDAFGKDPSKVDGVFNYESLIKESREKMTVITPQDGVITADYKLSLIKGTNQAKQDIYNKLVDYLMSNAIQKKIASTTDRRTKTSSSYENAFELPFPAQKKVVQSLLKAWAAEARKPAHMVFQIDTSGSMEDNMDNLRAALKTMTGESATTDSEKLLALQPREQVQFIEFSSGVKSNKTVKITDGSTSADYKSLDSYFDNMVADGGTSIYDTLEKTLEDAKGMVTDDSTTSVVLFTDGENNGDTDFDGFKDWYSRNKAVHGIPVYTISFADANSEELDALASFTGGRQFSASSDLSSAFKEVRGYL